VQRDFAPRTCTGVRIGRNRGSVGLKVQGSKHWAGLQIGGLAHCFGVSSGPGCGDREGGSIRNKACFLYYGLTPGVRWTIASVSLCRGEQECVAYPRRHPCPVCSELD
jgi:hypothetical protein